MRYIVLLNGAQPSTPPPPGLMEAIMKLGEEATKAGALLDTAGLAPSAAGARIHRDHWAGWEGTANVLKVMGPEDFAPPTS